MITGEFEHVSVDFIYVNRDARQRRELVGIEELAASINRVGLIHPPVIERSGELRVGERRWTAVKSLGWDKIPVQYVDELDETELQLLELEENVKRINLNWTDECLAVQRYHELQMELTQGWSVAATADMLGIAERSVQEKLLVAKELRGGNKRVMEAPKFSVARNVTARVNERRKADAITTAISALPSFARPEPKPVKSVPLINTDFTEWAASYTGPQFNLIHCDFPYGVNADKQAQGTQVAELGGYADSIDVYLQLLDTLESNMSTVVSPSAHLVFWYSMDFYQMTKDRLEQMGWKVDPFPLIWYKSDNTGMLPDAQRGYRRNYETAFFGIRGDRKLTARGAAANIFSHPGRDKSIHMSEKPVPMLKHFMAPLVDEYTRALDPTCGSGNSIKAATQLGAREALGIERDAEFYNRAVEAFFDGE
jgi:ParB/RepB/Spo0J family partition protein